ncbi:MAG: inner membrane CreD family protein, partial [Candidatus Contendobacter sp.]
MKYGLLAKVSLIVLITLLLATGLTRISFLVDERVGRRNQVVADVAAGTARAQTLIGPVLVVPYTRIVKVSKRSQKDKNK